MDSEGGVKSTPKTPSQRGLLGCVSSLRSSMAPVGARSCYQSSSASRRHIDVPEGQNASNDGCVLFSWPTSLVASAVASVDNNYPSVCQETMSSSHIYANLRPVAQDKGAWRPSNAQTLVLVDFPAKPAATRRLTLRARFRPVAATSNDTPAAHAEGHSAPTKG